MLLDQFLSGDKNQLLPYIKRAQLPIFFSQNDECYAREEKYRDMQTLVLQKCRLACSALYAAYKDGNAGCSNLPDPRVVKFLAVRDVLAYALQKRLLKTHCPVTDVEQVFLEEDIRSVSNSSLLFYRMNVLVAFRRLGSCVYLNLLKSG
jgi:hypothetical protein